VTWSARAHKLVFGTTFGYMEPMLKVAADTPTSSSSTPPATRRADQHAHLRRRTYEGAYMAGVIAGSMTKTNTWVWSAPSPSLR
jgi:basic membrane protein A